MKLLYGKNHELPTYRYTLTLMEGREGVVTDVLHFYTLLALLDYVEEHKKKTYTITRTDLSKAKNEELLCDNSRVEEMR